MLAVVSASDALMLGSLDQDAMSAVSLAGQIAFVENLFLEAMILGLSALAAQYWGKGDRAAVERIFAYVMKVTALERSDIDVAVAGGSYFDSLQEEIEEIPTLYKIDLVNLDTCRNTLLLEDIREYGREI